jgi:hypothetical protein
MSCNRTKQYQSLPWQTRKVLVRSLFAELCEHHRHQLTLWQLRHRYKPSSTLAGMALDHGIGRYGAPLPRGIRKLAERACYAHATALMLHDQERFIYYEGYALRLGGGAVNHAWVLDRENGDQVVDNTWTQPQSAVYLGVPLAPGFVREFMKTLRFGGTLLDYLWQGGEPTASEYWLFADAAGLPRDFTRANAGPPQHRPFRPKLVT